MHVAINEEMPIKIAKITNQAPAVAINFATAKLRFTEHESTTLTEYFEYVSSSLC